MELAYLVKVLFIINTPAAPIALRAPDLAHFLPAGQSLGADPYDISYLRNGHPFLHRYSSFLIHIFLPVPPWRGFSIYTWWKFILVT